MLPTCEICRTYLTRDNDLNGYYCESCRDEEEKADKLKTMMDNADPDSILGCIGKLKEALDAYNNEKVR